MANEMDESMTTGPRGLHHLDMSFFFEPFGGLPVVQMKP